MNSFFIIISTIGCPHSINLLNFLKDNPQIFSGKVIDIIEMYQKKQNIPNYITHVPSLIHLDQKGNILKKIVSIDKIILFLNSNSNSNNNINPNVHFDVSKIDPKKNDDPKQFEIPIEKSKNKQLNLEDQMAEYQKMSEELGINGLGNGIKFVDDAPPPKKNISKKTENINYPFDDEKKIKGFSPNSKSLSGELNKNSPRENKKIGAFNS